jgi:hypothetical protein
MATTEEKRIMPGTPRVAADVITADPSADQAYNFYILAYRTGKKMDTLEFSSEGTLREAIEEGREYCRLRRLAFLNVSPYFQNIGTLNAYYKSTFSPDHAASVENRVPGQVY